MNAETARRSPDALLEQAVARHRGGQLADAEALYREVLAMAPEHPGALHYLGLLGLQTGHLAAAEELLARAARATPGDPMLLNNWGIALAKLGRHGEARQRFEIAIERGPGYADAVVNLANLLADAGEYDIAEQHYREAIAIAPRSAEAHNNLGRLLLSRKRLPEAVASLEEALRASPGHASALNNLGNALREQGRLDEAFRRYREAQRARPDHPEAFSNMLLAMNCDPGLSAAEVFAAHREFSERFETPLGSGAIAPSGPRASGRLRIGYVSADFRAHAVAAFIEPLFACHDRSRFEVTAYSNTFAEDEVTSRIRGAVEHFAVIASLSDAEFAQRVRSDNIDVLVDLSGHSAGNRLLAFARRAAPVQATWLGYLNTTGLRAMDFRLTDNWADPPGLTERWHTETLVRLPGSQWCYGPWPDSPPVAAAPCLARGHVTFGSTNNPAKLNPEVLAAWGRILGRVPASRLLVHAPDDEELRARLLAVLAHAGVDAGRVSFFPRLPASEYLRRYADIDILLDPFPCAGGTTTLDAIWMGVTTISFAGERPFSRGGASILGNLGMPDCLADSSADYVELAVALASDAPALATRREALRESLMASTLMDAGAFVRSVETAFVQMCRLRGHLPREGA